MSAKKRKRRKKPPSIFLSPEDRFDQWYKETKSGCWLWAGYVAPHGYAVFNIDGARVYVHRWAYERFIGPIPSGKQIHHTCERKHCVNPDHLEIVTPAEHLLKPTRSGYRRTETRCKRGHDLTVPKNVTLSSSGGKICRICTNNWHNERQQKLLREDPEYAEKIRKRDRKRYRRNMQDPEWRERERVRNRERMRRG